MEIFKDYTLKIKNKSYFNDIDTIATDVNNLIVLLNYCFNKKNNFFVEKFNKKNIFPVCNSYNILKTNILSKEPFNNVSSIFSNIKIEDIKTIKFILFNFINNYDSILSENPELKIIEKSSIQNCINLLNKI